MRIRIQILLFTYLFIIGCSSIPVDDKGNTARVATWQIDNVLAARSQERVALASIKKKDEPDKPRLDEDCSSRSTEAAQMSCDHTKQLLAMADVNNTLAIALDQKPQTAEIAYHNSVTQQKISGDNLKGRGLKTLAAVAGFHYGSKTVAAIAGASGVRGDINISGSGNGGSGGSSSGSKLPAFCSGGSARSSELCEQFTSGGTTTIGDTHQVISIGSGTAGSAEGITADVLNMSGTSSRTSDSASNITSDKINKSPNVDELQGDFNDQDGQQSLF